MPDIIACPRCQRKLRLDESAIGQTVACPSCQHAFTATGPDKPSSLPRRDDPPVYQPVEDAPPPRPRYDDPPQRRRRDEDDDEDYPRPRRSRRYYDDGRKPHRGSTVQTLGLLAMVFMFCTPFVGAILAIIAIVMALTDLSAMSKGEMDDAGRSQTKTGLICGVVALALLGLGVFACIGINLLDNM